MTAKRPSARSGEAGREHRDITDPLAMRAVAHPMRIALLEALMREGPLTATRAAELLDDSPGNMSWHLQTLAKYGFVEDAGDGRGRSRPWRLVALTHNFETGMADPARAAAGEALESSFQERNIRRLREWWSQRRSYPAKWRKAAFVTDALTYLTAEEMTQIGEDIRTILLQYRDRSRDKSARPPDALPVHLVAFGHPVPPTPTGN
jgi:DNA-binding transcriptional ArsR family regulator